MSGTCNNFDTRITFSDHESYISSQDPFVFRVRNDTGALPIPNANTVSDFSGSYWYDEMGMVRGLENWDLTLKHGSDDIWSNGNGTDDADAGAFTKYYRIEGR